MDPKAVNILNSVSMHNTIRGSKGVAELIDVNPTQRREPLIQNIFSAMEVDIICNIPISNYYQKDKMIWHATSTGEFFVKSAYHIEKEHQGRKKGEGSNHARSQVVWKTTWGLKVPNLSKVFLWSACNNILPNKDNLKRRGIVDEELCIFC